MKRIISLIFIFILIVILGFLLYGDLSVVMADIKKENVIEINTQYKISDFIKKIYNGKLENGDEEVIFNELGFHKINAKFKNELGKIKEEEINVYVVDTESPEISAPDNIYIYSDETEDELDFLKEVTIIDNSLEEIIPTIEGEYDINVPGTYKLSYVAKDSSNNESIKEFNLVVKMRIPDKDTYYVKINKTLNVIMVYRKDKNGEYNVLVKTMVASAGQNTPVGIFKANGRHEVISFEAGTFGHYATRIYKSFWFHSVPYQKRSNGDWDTILYNEYNKLGNWASAGCVRLQVIDAIWIYENIVDGTTIEIYESNKLPNGVIKPTPKKIDVNSEYRGWDPTDPNPNNPWNL